MDLKEKILQILQEMDMMIIRLDARILQLHKYTEEYKAQNDQANAKICTIKRQELEMVNRQLKEMLK